MGWRLVHVAKVNQTGSCLDKDLELHVQRTFFGRPYGRIIKYVGECTEWFELPGFQRTGMDEDVRLSGMWERFWAKQRYQHGEKGPL